MKTIDKYLFQAMDNYPYWLEGTIESLDYALSYNDKNPMVLGLYGRIQAEQLQDYEEAKRYYEKALAIDIHAVALYPYYLDALLLNEDYDEAEKLITFALTIKGIAKVAILLRQVVLLERKQDLKGAIKLLKEVKLASYDNDSYEIEAVEKRLKAKKELLKPKSSNKKKKDKKGKKK
jgi:tetratricopeptide (TPR) repeat protein